jgi:hypothetical protein
MWRRCKKMSLTEEYIYRERVREREWGSSTCRNVSTVLVSEDPSELHPPPPLSTIPLPLRPPCFKVIRSSPPVTRRRQQWSHSVLFCSCLIWLRFPLLWFCASALRPQDSDCCKTTAALTISVSCLRGSFTTNMGLRIGTECSPWLVVCILPRVCEDILRGT